jgi:hypothetical protein
MLFIICRKHLFDAGFKLTYLPAEQSNGIMKFDLLKDPQSKARAEALLLITV